MGTHLVGGMDEMGALNTFFNFQTAGNTAKSAYALGSLHRADRERELRARGWLRPSSTPGEWAWVEAVLAAQMRARVEIKSVHPRPWPYVKVLVGGVVAFLAVAALMGAAKQHQVIGWLGGSGLVVVICGAAA
ncbi:MAG: hypothetical protein K0S40_4155, partial [Actinomycetospora sp.]|nr:hypothetical protein [Actinomycetospora sp.]